MKKLLAFVGIVLLVGVIVVTGIIKYGERGIRTVDLSEGKISFEWLVEPKMNSVHWTGGGLFSIQERERASWDVINASGDVLLNDFYRVSGIRTKSFVSSDVFVIKDDGMKSGLATMSGDILIEPQYRRIELTKVPEIWEVFIRERFGDPTKSNFIDRNGNKMFKEDFSSFVYLLNKDRFIHKSGDKFGVIDRDLNVIVKYECPEIRDISVDRIAIRKDTGATGSKNYLYGLYDSNGTMILPMEYESIGLESEGLIAVKKNGKIGFVDRDGNLKINFIRARKSYGRFWLPQFKDGMAAIMTHRFPLLSNISFLDKYTMQMIKTEVIDTKGQRIFSTSGFLRDYSQGVFLIDKGKQDEFVLLTRSGESYPIPKHVFSGAPGEYPSARDLNNGVITIGINPIKKYENTQYGLLKFTIKEK